MTAPLVALVSSAEVYSGAERCLCVVAEGLRDAWRFVALVSDRSDPELRERLATAGAEVVAIPGLRRAPTPAGMAGLRRALRDHRPDLVHVNATDQRDAIGSLLIAGGGTAPSVATVHLVLPERARWRERAAVLALRRLDRVVAISDASAAALAARGVPAAVIRNGLAPTPQRADARALLGLEEGAFVVGGVGRLDPQKGWDVLCDAAALVAGRHARVVFAIVGDGPERAALEARPTGRHVRLLGYRAAASSLMSAFDVLAVPSRYEGLPLVVIDAMHAGVPVVGTNVGGMGELLAGPDVTVPVEDASALAQALERLIGDDAARRALGDAARERASTLFGADRMVTETAALYGELLGRAPAS